MRVDPGFLFEPVVGEGVEAAAIAGQIFSFLLCEFFADHRVYRSGCRVGGADLSALIITKLHFDKIFIVSFFDNIIIVINFDKIFIVMKNVIGTPARGDSFFPRDKEIQKIIDKLSNGNNLNIAAPRRVGKTSILLNLLDKKENHFVYVYVDSEDVNNESDYFKRILKEVLRTEEIVSSRRLRNLFESGQRFLSRIKGVKIMGQGIEFTGEDGVVDFKDDLTNLLSGIELEDDKEIIILVDEFPQTIQNIIDASPDDPKPARKFLQANREIRLNPEISRKVKFILTGSIGLNHTVAQIDSTAFINDLNSVEIAPLTDGEAQKFLQELLATKNILVGTEVAQYLLKKIVWLIPFHIQLAVQEILSMVPPGACIDEALIDRAFDAIVERRNENHFNHYFSRLKRQFKGDEFSFADELLDILARKGIMRKDEIINLAVKYSLMQKWKGIADILIYDGYINSNSEGIYQFNSPVIRMWWQRFICK
jgi:AAA+ ATPase superfamily predicted ATPase